MSERIAELKPRPRNRVVVRLSGGRFFTIPDEQAHTLSVGLELSDREVGRLEQMDQYFRGREKALRLITLRMRTRQEVVTALGKIEIREPVLGGILDELEEQGLVDDARYAREFARARAEDRFMGPHRLRHDLAKRGVRRDIVDAALGETFDQNSQEAQAWALVERKIGHGMIDEKTVRRIAGLLQRKGYDYEIVNRVSYELLRRAGSENAAEET